MKNRMKLKLKRELENVRISGELKKRILAEAEASRMPQGRGHISLRPLAAAAAVALVVGLTAGVVMLRSEKPDLSATPLSTVQTAMAEQRVWADASEGLYHASADCSQTEESASMPLNDARALGLKGCSNCIETGSDLAEDLVWMTDYGRHYHAAKDCSGMTGAVGVLEIEAKTLGRQTCPICIGEGDIQATLEPTVAATEAPFGTPMPSPVPMPTAAATEAPFSMPEPTAAATEAPAEPMSVAIVMNDENKASFWMTDGGVYYHLDEHSSGMEGAHECTEDEAAKAGKILCMVCMPVETENSDVVYDTEDMWVWTTDGGVYYHQDEHCSGMEDAHGCSSTEALAAGKQPCPKCAQQTDSVWATVEGKYYHLREDCSGMVNAQEMTESNTAAEGKTLCPNCQQETELAAEEAFIESDK